MGMVNVKLPLNVKLCPRMGRNHLLASYLIMGFVASPAYAVS